MRNIKEALLSLLAAGKFDSSRVAFGPINKKEIVLVFKSTWTFDVDSKDVVIRRLIESDELLSSEELSAFARDNTYALLKDKKLKRPFCVDLESKSAKEVFDICNRINRIAPRSARGRCNCPDCHGSTKTNCPNCSGYGKILCPSCQGRDNGCTRCRHTGYIVCPSCRGERKLPCSKCKSTGSVIIERQISLLANTHNVIEYEGVSKNDKVDIPGLHIDNFCFDSILNNCDFKLADAEFKQDNSFLLTYKATTEISYVKLSVHGINNIFNFYTVGANAIPLNIPPIFDYEYALLKHDLTEAAVGKTMTLMSKKIELFRDLAKNPFFNSLLTGYEADYNGITKRLISDKAFSEPYMDKANFTMRTKLESMVATRKDDLSDVLANKLISHTRHLVSDDFAKESCMSLVEFIIHLKYRSRFSFRMWNLATLTIWVVSFLYLFFSPHAFSAVISIFITVICCVIMSYYVTQNLKLSEVISSSRTLHEVSKFTDLNYDVIRSFITLMGVILIDIVLVWAMN